MHKYYYLLSIRQCYISQESTVLIQSSCLAANNCQSILFTLARYLKCTIGGKLALTRAFCNVIQGTVVRMQYCGLFLLLLEMKFQNRKLAKTLLDLNMEIQRLRNEIDMSAALESKDLSFFGNPD
uniref:Uncharacterized protein n=1 Tax=Pseudonaja textilis TaxID=8673 RepID=A0A670XRQ2_PSETE